MKIHAEMAPTEKPMAIYTQFLNQATQDGIAAAVPSFESMSGTLYRRQRRHVPSATLDAADLDISGEHASTLDGQEFLQIDRTYLGRNRNERRLLLFASDFGLRVLASSLVWSADGTFACCPSQFQQLYLIMCVVNGTAGEGQFFFPAAWCLLQQKDMITYMTLFAEIRNLLLERGLSPRVREVHTDYERAAINAFRSSFAECRIVGCHFHFSQCVWRWIQDSGYVIAYKSVPDFRKFIRLILALPFLRSTRIRPNFDALMHFVMTGFHAHADFIDFVGSFGDYFRSTWIPLCDVLSIYGCAHRTNNGCESYHGRTNRLLAAHRPNIFRLIKHLKSEESYFKGRITQILHGTAKIFRRTKYILLDEKITRFQDQLDDHAITEFEFLYHVSELLANFD